MKYSEIAQMSTTELVKLMKEERLQMTKMKFNHAVANLETPTKLKDQRRHVARILTELKKRKLEIAANA
jgi:large subunit ribosomal protein L29